MFFQSRLFAHILVLKTTTSFGSYSKNQLKFLYTLLHANIKNNSVYKPKVVTRFKNTAYNRELK